MVRGRTTDYLWFVSGPGEDLVGHDPAEPWIVAKAIRNLLDRDGATRDDIEDACAVARAKIDEVDSPVGYMAGTARLMATERRPS